VSKLKNLAWPHDFILKRHSAKNKKKIMAEYVLKLGPDDNFKRTGWHFTTKTPFKSVGSTVDKILKRKINKVYLNKNVFYFFIFIMSVINSFPFQTIVGNFIHLDDPCPPNRHFLYICLLLSRLVVLVYRGPHPLSLPIPFP
jgi:hypothetical protein